MSSPCTSRSKSAIIRLVSGWIGRVRLQTAIPLNQNMYDSGAKRPNLVVNSSFHR